MFLLAKKDQTQMKNGSLELVVPAGTVVEAQIEIGDDTTDRQLYIYLNVLPQEKGTKGYTYCYRRYRSLSENWQVVDINGRPLNAESGSAIINQGLISIY